MAKPTNARRISRRGTNTIPFIGSKPPYSSDKLKFAAYTINSNLIVELND
jgi:hypothetical protein